MSVSTERIIEALQPVNDPELNKSIVDLGMVKNISVQESLVNVEVALTIPGCPLKAKIEENEHKILSDYLPKQLSEEETKKICSEVAQKVGANSIKDMGKVMGELKKNYSDTLDFSKAGSILKEILGK